MTPFGARVRELRAVKGIQLKDMAQDLQVSSAYLSALEHGRRGRPGPGFVMQIANYFGLIWDEVDDLIRKGRDTERMALARALRLHLRRQVMVYRGRTAVFA